MKRVTFSQKKDAFLTKWAELVWGDTDGCVGHARSVAKTRAELKAELAGLLRSDRAIRRCKYTHVINAMD